jgi:hypothetical protein
MSLASRISRRTPLTSIPPRLYSSLFIYRHAFPLLVLVVLYRCVFLYPPFKLDHSYHC